MADWTSTEQYNPPGAEETTALDGLDVRAPIDLGRALNNMHDHVHAHKPVQSIALALADSPAVGVTDEYVVALLGLHRIPDGHDHLRYWSSTKRIAGASTVVWKIIVGGGGLYRSDEIYDSTLIDDERIASWSTSSDSKVVATGTINVSVHQNRWVWMYITATNADAATQARMLSLDLQWGVT